VVEVLRRLIVLLFLAMFVITVLSPLTAHAEAIKTLKDSGKGEVHHYKWVFMVYIDADNNLEGAAIYNFNQMEMAGSTDQVAIVVMFDRIPGYDSSNGNWTDTRIYLVLHDTDPHEIHSKLLADLGELDMGDPHTLVFFVNYTVHHFPADHYALVLWDHGNAWKRRQVEGAMVKGCCWDETNGWDYLTERELIWAMQQISKFAHIDVIGFDACLMGMAEIAYDLAPYTDILVASQEFEPWDGWYYTPFLQVLDANPNMTPKDLAKSIVEAYKYYYTLPEHLDNTVTLAAIDLKTFRSKFIPLFNYVSLAMLYNVFFKPDISYKIKAVRDRTEFTGGGEYVDVYNLLQKMNASSFWISDFDPRSYINQSLYAYNESVIAYYAGKMHYRAHGLSIYFPPSLDNYLKYRYLYFEQTNFANELVWPWFLDYYFYAFKPSLRYNVKISAPPFVVPGVKDYAFIEVSYGGKRVDPDSLSVKLVILNKTELSLTPSKIDTGLYLVKIPSNINASTALLMASSEYWFLQGTDITTIKVENLTTMIRSLNYTIVKGLANLGTNITLSFSDLKDFIETEIANANASIIRYVGKGIIEINTTLGTLYGRIVKVGNDVAEIETELGKVNVSLTKLLKDLNAKIIKVDGDIATVSSELGTINVKLSDLNTKIEYVGNNTVKISTALGTIEGNITEIKNGIVTIKTGLGSIKVSVDSIGVKLDHVKDLVSLMPKISSQQYTILNKSNEIESVQRRTEGLSIAILIIVLISLGVASYAAGAKRSS
jgi:hypothetical protein